MQDGAHDLPRVQTGIAGFDALLRGGVPAGRTLLVTGDTGTGKTVLLNEFLYRGATEHGERGVLITFEECAEDVRRNVAAFGWDYPALEREGTLRIIEISPEVESLTLQIEAGHPLSRFVDPIMRAVTSVGATRVAIDGVGAIFGMFQSDTAVRHLFHLLVDRLKDSGATTLISAESENGRSVLSAHGVERFVVDGLIELTTEMGDAGVVRRIVVRKLRGGSYQTGKAQFVIHDTGLRVFPRLPTPARKASDLAAPRKSFGIPGFDEILHGGLPDAHLALFSGNTGTGKTTFGLHFLKSGCEIGEPGIFLAIEEPSGQVRQTAAGYGWAVERDEAAGLLRFLDYPAIELRVDEVLLQLDEAMRSTGARRLVVDSLTGMESVLLDPEAVRLFLQQLSDLCKANKVACVLPYTAPAVFGAAVGQLFGAVSVSEARLASLVDGIVLMRFVESEQEVTKLLNVLKLRGSPHAKDIYRYDISDHGVEGVHKWQQRRRRRP